MDDGIRVTNYKIADHAKGAQKLIDRYLIPFYLERMGIKAEDRVKYSHIEDVLDPNRILDPAFEFASYVALNGKGEVVGCYLNYKVTRSRFLKEWLENDKRYASDSNLPKSVRDYCQHSYSLFDGLERAIFDQYNLDEIIYCESFVTDPKYRGHHLADLSKEMNEKDHGVKYHFLVDSTLPIDLYMSKKNNVLFLSPVGSVNEDYELIRRLFTYDKHVVLVEFSTPALMSSLLKKSKL